MKWTCENQISGFLNLSLISWMYCHINPFLSMTSEKTSMQPDYLEWKRSIFAPLLKRLNNFKKNWNNSNHSYGILTACYQSWHSDGTWVEFGCPERGPVAQMGARINRTDEVEGSNPSRSIGCWRAHSAVGSASQWHWEGRGFESLWVHIKAVNGILSHPPESWN